MLDPAPLAEIDALMKKAKANGVLIRNGYLVAEWNHAGSEDTRIDIQSCGKSITSMVLGVAITDDVVPLRYGLAWWSRTFYEKDEWYMSGNGGQFCFLLPKENIVMVKTNDWRNKVQVNHQEFYPLVKKAAKS